MSDVIIRYYERREEPKKLGCFGVRHTLAIMLFLGYTLIYTMRVCLSVAILAMVRSSKENKFDFTNATDENVCPFPELQSEDQTNFTVGELIWDEGTKGNALGAFFMGYTVTNFFGGRMADYFGGYYVIGIGVFMSSITTVMNPLAARNSPTFFIVVKVLHGISDGLSFPCIHNIIAKWYPKEERSKFTAFIYSGNCIGTVLSLSISGWLSSSDVLGGWPSVFYAFGCLSMTWSVVWFFLIRSEPGKHPRISEAEMDHITSGCVTRKRLPVPWKSIFLSKHFWVTAGMHFGHNFGNYTIMIEIPSYINDILHIDIKNNGVISSMPFLGMWLFSLVYSYTINTICDRGLISILTMRRISAFIAGYILAIGMVGMCFVNCDSSLAIATLIGMGTLSGAVFCGFVCSHADISPNFAGTLMGFTNTLGNTPGFVTPLLVGALTKDNNTISAWRVIFIISATITGVTTTLYMMFVTTEIQPWNSSKYLNRRKRDSKEVTMALRTKNSNNRYR